MDANTTANNVWTCKSCKKKPLSKKSNDQSHMDRCKVYKDHVKSNCIDDGFQQQLKQDILNEVDMFSDASKDDIVNVKTHTNIEQSYDFKIS